MSKIEVGKRYVWEYALDGPGRDDDGAVVEVVRRDTSDTYWITTIVVPTRDGHAAGDKLWVMEEELTPVEDEPETPEAVLEATVESYNVDVSQNLRVVALGYAVQLVSALPALTGTALETADEFYEWLTKEEN